VFHFVDIQITDFQTVDIQITDFQTVDIQITYFQTFDIQIAESKIADIDQPNLTNLIIPFLPERAPNTCRVGWVL
jgi:hypothetical protein